MLVFAIVVALVLLCTACVVLLGIAASGTPNVASKSSSTSISGRVLTKPGGGWEVRHKLEQAEDIAVFEAPVTAEYVGRIG